MGIVLAFTALVSWGVGDFLIQKSARKFGDWVALFYITAFSVVVLLPFVWHEIIPIVSNVKHLAFLIVTSIIILGAALLDFEALRVGKIAVVEPIYALEVPVTAGIATFIIRESLTLWQTVLVACLMLGIFLVATKTFRHLKNIRLERGVWLASGATIMMGVTNALFGVGGRATSPLMVNWFTDVFMTIVIIVYLFLHARCGEIIRDWKKNKKLIISVAVADNAAWITYTYSMVYIPIAIATSISESYIALASILGITLNGERLHSHQKVGLVICVIAAITLAAITNT